MINTRTYNVLVSYRQQVALLHVELHLQLCQALDILHHVVVALSLLSQLSL